MEPSGWPSHIALGVNMKCINVKELREYLDHLEESWDDRDDHFLGEFQYQRVYVPYFSLDGDNKFEGVGTLDISYDPILGLILQQSEAEDENSDI